MALPKIRIFLIIVIVFIIKYLKPEVLLHLFYMDLVVDSILRLLHTFCSELWLNVFAQCLLFLVFLVCTILLVFTAFLSDMGLLTNKTPYAVSLGDCFPEIVEAIVTLASCEDIKDLRKHMYEKRYLGVPVYEELMEKDSELSSQEQVNIIIQEALHRGESKMRVIRALVDSFRAMATDRNRCAEIAEQIKLQGRKRRMVKRWIVEIFYRILRYLWKAVTLPTRCLNNMIFWVILSLWSGSMVFPRGAVKVPWTKQLMKSANGVLRKGSRKIFWA